MFPVNRREEDSDGVKLKGRAHIAADIIKVQRKMQSIFITMLKNKKKWTHPWKIYNMINNHVGYKEG